LAFFERGGIALGKVAGVPVRMRWTAPLGAYVFTGFRFDALAWVCFFGLILVHEVGHALVVRACRAKPTLLEFTGTGGLCHWEGEVREVGRAAIAWGGVWAQAIVLLGAMAYAWLVPTVSHEAWRVLHTLTDSNAMLIAFNLVPVAPLDGAQAWALPMLLGRRAREALSQGRSNPEAKVESVAREMVTDFLDEARKDIGP
jgi:Zn-dependent protease